MTDPAIIEAAAHALRWSDHRSAIEAIVAAVTPLIRANALEEAAVVAEDAFPSPCAAAIRALKEQL